MRPDSALSNAKKVGVKGVELPHDGRAHRTLGEGFCEHIGAENDLKIKLSYEFKRMLNIYLDSYVNMCFFTVINDLLEDRRVVL